jgi:hypothetical protein
MRAWRKSTTHYRPWHFLKLEELFMFITRQWLKISRFITQPFAFYHCKLAKVLIDKDKSEFQKGERELNITIENVGSVS